MKNRIKAGSAIAIVLLAATLAGCSGYADPDAVSRRVTEVTGVPFETVSTVTIGRSAFHIARLASRAAEGPPPALIQDLKDLKWGSYRVSAAGERPAGTLRLSPSHFSGYSAVFARQAGTGEGLLLLSRGSGERVDELLLVVDGVDQLTIVQVRGRLENLLEEAVRLALGEAEREDLVEEAVNSLESAPAGGS